MVSLVASLETALKVMPEGKERKIALKTLPGIQGGKEGTPLPATEILTAEKERASTIDIFSSIHCACQSCNPNKPEEQFYNHVCMGCSPIFAQPPL